MKGVLFSVLCINYALLYDSDILNALIGTVIIINCFLNLFTPNCLGFKNFLITAVGVAVWI